MIQVKKQNLSQCKHIQIRTTQSKVCECYITCNLLVKMPWITLGNCERLAEWARTIKQSQVNSSNKCKSYLLVSCKSAVLKFPTT